jgi:hypothetical protein
MRSVRIGAVLLLATVLACNSVAGINDPKDKDPGASSGASGGTSGAAGDVVARFIGTWSTPAANQRITNCNASPVTPAPATIVLTRGAQSGTIVVSPSGGSTCGITCAVEGNVATALDGQGCTATLPNEVDTYSYIAPTSFTLTSDTQANVQITASVFVNPPGVTCGFEETSVYTKN